MAPSDDDYQPSQELNETIATLDLPPRRQVMATAKQRIARLYEHGSLLDSQTTDSQFQFTEFVNEPLAHAGTSQRMHVQRQADGVLAGDHDGRINVKDESVKQIPVAFVGQAISCPHAGVLPTDLQLAHAEIRMLRDQVRNLEAIRQIQDDRIRKL
ncbi:hypothetical protein BD414DRAFT_527953 [Trametes punicea]|nr:hypothetical protein BD414DRAFT_527953 [Trametes punicea]